jgi:hypothetical protein
LLVLDAEAQLFEDPDGPGGAAALPDVPRVVKN